MSAQEKLQQAIETTIAAGYQLNSEAFDFLFQNAESNDPVTLLPRPLQTYRTATKTKNGR